MADRYDIEHELKEKKAREDALAEGTSRRRKSDLYIPENIVGWKVDGNFYGHLKAGSHKASKKIKGTC